MISSKKQTQKLRMLPLNKYPRNEHDDPLPFYYYPFFSDLYRTRVEMCLNALKPGGRILELGFGSGITFLNLHDMYDEIYGIDLHTDIQPVRATFANEGIEVRLCSASLLNLPYNDGFFDAALCISTLEHLRPENQALAMAEICRVLKPGGRFVYGVPIERPLMQFGFRLLGYDIREHHFSTENDVAQAAATSFKQIAIYPYRPFSIFTGKLYEVGVFDRV